MSFAYTTGDGQTISSLDDYVFPIPVPFYVNYVNVEETEPGTKIYGNTDTVVVEAASGTGAQKAWEVLHSNEHREFISVYPVNGWPSRAYRNHDSG